MNEKAMQKQLWNCIKNSLWWSRDNREMKQKNRNKKQMNQKIKQHILQFSKQLNDTMCP